MDEKRFTSGEIAGALTVLFIIGLFILAVFAIMSFETVGATERGVYVKRNVVQDEIKQPGFYFISPFFSNIVTMNVQTQKEEVEANSASKDLQSVVTKVALNFNADPGKVNELFKQVGKQKAYNEVVIAPALQEAVKATTAQFTAEELITKRGEVNAAIRKNIEERLAKNHIIVTDISIVNFSFSKEFDAAIEAKQTAEQNAKRAENDLKRIEIEAKQKIETAKAEAESIRIQGQALRESNNLVELKAVERWNGQLPQYMMGDGATPFINLNK